MIEDPSGFQVMPRTDTVTGSSAIWRNWSRESGLKIQIVFRTLAWAARSARRRPSGDHAVSPFAKTCGSAAIGYRWCCSPSTMTSVIRTRGLDLRRFLYLEIGEPAR